MERLSYYIQVFNHVLTLLSILGSSGLSRLPSVIKDSVVQITTVLFVKRLATTSGGRLNINNGTKCFWYNRNKLLSLLVLMHILCLLFNTVSVVPPGLLMFGL